MLIRNMLLNERRSLEQLLASLASEFPFILLLDEGLSRFTQLSENIC